MNDQNPIKFSVTKKDFDLTFFNSGKGGQKQNRHPTNVRLKHRDTGITVIATEYSKASQNKKLAIQKIAKNPKFLAFCDLKLREIENKQTVEEWVEEQMDPKNIKTEVKNEDGIWVPDV